GLEIHEAPTASSKNEDVFRPNMLITIEPGIYIPKMFGVRIEDLSIVRDSDIIILSESEKELIIL
ncbi:MAG: M24 family metallopeptidase, partial [Clostridia bacterium]|nr:M24 family metallopeptidase [Clostridia bacterium]